jgi:hypothetical protein
MAEPDEMTEEERAASQALQDYFDSCPQCGRAPVLMNVGKVHFEVCKACFVYWL